MKQFTPRQRLHAPDVWSPEGKKLIPHVGSFIPKGSYKQEGAEFVTLPNSIWVLVSTGCDDMGKKYPPMYDIQKIDEKK